MSSTPGTPATLARAGAGISFAAHTYDHDPRATSFGLEAAEKLGIGYSTAREYLDRIRSKSVEVGRPAPTKVDLLRRAVEDGILPGLDDSADGR